MFLILALLAVLLVLYIFVIRPWSYFIDRNVKFERGVPVLGTLAPVILGRTAITDVLANVYNKYPSDRYVGIYDVGSKPSVLVRDPELIKAISIKDFDSFVNHNFQMDKDTDPLMGRVLFSAKDQKWRDMRSVLSPLFTGSKMRMMLSLMADSIEMCTNHLRQEITEKCYRGGALEYNMMDVLSAFANDVIASCAFGIQMNTLKEMDNEFFKAGKAIAYAVQSVKTLAVTSMPALSKFFRVKIIDKKYDEFFREVVRSNVKQRQERNIVRNDMIQLMLMAQQGNLDLKEKEELSDAGFATISEVISSRAAEKLRDLTEDDFVAQCLVFFLAGFTGVATTMCFLCHELAVQPDIQKRLRREIDAVHESLNGERVTYEALQKMIYLDQVISEVLRKWPIAFMLDRRVNKQYLLENSDGSKMILQPGDVVWFPVHAIHRDPKYYPNPDVFDPDRFSVENRASFNMSAYLPFGIGPRSCVGTRFALMELKASIYYLIRDFYLECSEKTAVPLKLKPGSFSIEAENGFWLQLKIRNKD